MEKLNVGCAEDYRNGWVNLDFDKKYFADIYFDLRKIYDGGKLPFDDNYFDLIVMYDVLEHLPEPLPILRELYRVCKVDGKIELKVPYGDSVWYNLDHKRMFFLNSFLLNNFDCYGKGNEKKLRLIFMRLYILPTKSFLKKVIYGIFLKSINRLIKVSPSLYDQTPIRYIFQKTNIHVVLRKIG